MAQKQSRFKGFFKEMTPDRIDMIAEIMTRLVGETVQSKVLRAILMGAIAAGAQLAQVDEPISQTVTAHETAPSK